MNQESPHAKTDRLLELCDEVGRIAAALAELSNDLGEPVREDQPSDTLNDLGVPIDHVNWLIRSRRARGKYLTPELFADPAWDILLDLLRAEIVHERISVSSASIVADVPQTTGLRWLKALELRGLVIRKSDQLDARRTLVVLSPETSQALRRYFLEVIGTPPQVD